MILNQNDKSLNPGYYIDPRAGAINGAAEIAPASVNLDMGFIDIPTPPDPAAAPPPQAVNQRPG